MSDDEQVEVTIHGKYGKDPMPVEFRDALVEVVKLVKRGIDDGTIGRKRHTATRPPAPPEEEP